MSLKVSDLTKGMLAAASEEIKDGLPDIKEMLKTELKGVAEGIVMVQKLLLQNKITRRQAKLLIRMKEDNAKIILLTVEGLGLILAERAINAAIDSVRDTVNAALSFKLL